MDVRSINRLVSWLYAVGGMFIVFDVFQYFATGIVDGTTTWIVLGLANAWSITGCIVEAIQDSSCTHIDGSAIESIKSIEDTEE